MNQTTSVSVARTADGVRVRVVGRATFRESACVSAFADGALAGGARVVVDLRGCPYVDSTFLGSLVSLHKHAAARGGRYAIAVGAEERRHLFGVTGLDEILVLVDEPPTATSGDTPLVMPPVDAGVDLGKHVMECHRRLAELGGPQAEAFRAVADELARELHKAR